MKYLMLIISLFMFSISGSAQVDAIAKYFSKYQEDSDFTVVYISPKMFEMVSKLAEEEIEPEVQAIIKDLKGLRVLTTEKSPMKYYNEVTQILNLKAYEELMTIRDGNSNVRFLIKSKEDLIEELLLLVGSEEEFVMISFVGKIDLEKISKLSNSANIEGLQHLEKIDQE